MSKATVRKVTESDGREGWLVEVDGYSIWFESEDEAREYARNW